MKRLLAMMALSTATSVGWSQTAAELVGKWQMVVLAGPKGMALNIERELGTKEVFQIFGAPNAFEGVVGEQRARHLELVRRQQDAEGRCRGAERYLSRRELHAVVPRDLGPRMGHAHVREALSGSRGIAVGATLDAGLVSSILLQCGGEAAPPMRVVQDVALRRDQHRSIRFDTGVQSLSAGAVLGVGAAGVD